MIYDATGAEASEGKRPLAVAVYFARLTQALIAALSAPMPEGILFKVDMRLRPSGRQGPVATSLAGFRRYQTEEAWTWEHLALTRARVVAGPEPLFGQVAAAIAEVLAAPHDATKVLADARDMRRRLSEAHEAAAGHPWEIKLGPGRMMDIELLAQAGALIHNLSGLRRPRRMLERLTRLGWLSADDGARLAASLARLSALQQVGRLASDHTIDPAEGGEGLVRLVLATAGRRRPRRIAQRSRRRGRRGCRNHRRATRRSVIPRVFHSAPAPPATHGRPAAKRHASGVAAVA